MKDNLKLKPEEKYQKYLDLLMDSENDKNISKEDKDFLFSYLLSAVDDGFVPAQKRYAFGLIKGYIDGYTIDKDIEKGKTILLSIMDKDNEVMKYVGKSYLYGNNTFPLDIPQGIELLKKSESYHSLGYYFRDKDIKKSLEYYLNEYNKNDIDSAFEIADIYYFEDEVKDVELALKYFKEFYEYAKTEYINYTVHDGYQYVVTKSFYVTIGNTYLIRMSIKNIDKAIYFYNEGIKLNDILSYEYLYLIYSDKNAGYYDIKRGINLLEKCYEMKNIWSTQELIKIYKNNKEVKNKEKALFYTFELVNMDFEMSEEDKNKEIAKTYYAFDDPKCIEYYEKAHDYLSLYLRYYSNSFGLNDIDKTIEYYKLSHENNIHYYTIASLYEKKEDYKTAFEYYNKGLENKEEDSIARLSLYYSWGIYVKRDYRMSYECDKMLVNSKNGSALAKANIALRQIYGVDEEVEPSEAMESLKKLSDEGNNYAMAYYARELYEGDNIEKDLNKAYELFKKTETNSLSKFYLGLYYKYGIKVEKDYNKAFEYFNKTNFFSTYFELGKCYLYGFGTKKNVKLAKYNFKIAYYYGTKSALREYALACQYEVDDSSLVDDFKIINNAYKNGLTDLKETRDELLEKIKAQEKKSNEYITHKTDVFISWYHKNIEVKNDIKKYLTDNSISVWESDEAPRKELDPAIIEAIKYAKSFLIILSYESINYSGYMPIEIDMIYDRVEKGFPLENISIFILPTEGHPVYDVSKAIKEKATLNDSAYSRIYKMHQMFAEEKNDSIVYDKTIVLNRIKRSVINYYINEYKARLIDDFSSFSYALPRMDALSSFDYYVPSSISFDFGYIEPKIYSFDKEIEYSYIKESDSLILIYSNGGSGKTLFCENYIRKYLDNESLPFYIKVREMIDYMDKNNIDSFIETLHKMNFDEDRVPLSIFKEIFNNTTNKFYFFVDGLDEAIDTIEFIKKIKTFIDNNSSFKDRLHFIFTSRNLMDYRSLEDILKTKVNTIKIGDFTTEDVLELFKKLIQNYNYQHIGKELEKESLVHMINKVSTNTTLLNPLLLSNLFYIYVTTGKVFTKEHDILKNTIDIMIKSLEEYREVKFKYDEVLSQHNLSIPSVLFEFSYIKSNGSTKDALSIINEILNKYGIDDNNVSSSLLTFLKRRSLIVKDDIKEKIYKTYLSSLYLYKDIYEEKDNKLILPYKNRKKLDIFKIMTQDFDEIYQNFLFELDFEIYDKTKLSNMDEDNPEYKLYNKSLRKLFKKKYLSNNRIKNINNSLSKYEFYYNSFLKKKISNKKAK